MTENFNVIQLREKLYSNLKLIVGQIEEYSNKFNNKLTEVLDKKIKYNKTLQINNDLKKIDYKIKNDISDKVYFMINDLTKMINKTSNSKILNDNINNYMKDFKFSNNILKNLDLLKDDLLFNIKDKNSEYTTYINRFFDSYIESINFAINSINKKINDLINESLKEFNIKNEMMKNDESFLLALSFFNITYDNDKDELFVNDTKLEKKDENIYRINDNINLVIKPANNMTLVGIVIDNKLKKAINLNNNLNSISFFTDKKDKSYVIDYNFDNGFLSTYENSKIKDSNMIDLDKLDENIEKYLNMVDTNLIGFIKKLENNKINVKENELPKKS